MLSPCATSASRAICFSSQQTLVVELNDTAPLSDYAIFIFNLYSRAVILIMPSDQKLILILERQTSLCSVCVSVLGNLIEKKPSLPPPTIMNLTNLAGLLGTIELKICTVLINLKILCLSLISIFHWEGDVRKNKQHP